MRIPSLILALTVLAQLPAQAQESSDVSKPHLKNSKSSQYFRGVSFRNANKVEFKYKERLKNYREQLKMGIEKNWLTSQEVQEFKEKLDVLAKLEKKVSARKYPKKEVDHMEKMFTLYNQQFHKASTTPMEKKVKKEKKVTTKSEKVKTKSKKSKVKKAAKKKNCPSKKAK